MNTLNRPTIHPLNHRLAVLCLALVCAGATTARAATITVTSTADNGAGSLREALASAADGDTIDFSVTGTISLTSGELLVTKSVDIVGPGPGDLAVDGNAASRVFHIGSGKTVTISSLTVTNGSATLGGGMYNDHSTLTVSNCILSGNSATGNGHGGGIYNDGDSGSATLTIADSAISANRAYAGGGIWNAGVVGSATVTIVNSTISGNTAEGPGGAIFNDSGSGGATVTIANSTISGNSAGSAGGGIFNSGTLGSPTVTIANSTLADNSAGDFGGGGAAIINWVAFSGNATVTIANSTFSGNSASGAGGGIVNYSPSGGSTMLEIGSTILKAGDSGINIVNAGGTVTSRGYNLSSDDGGGFLAAMGDQVNTDPLLGPLQDNGGATFTHALLACSPAIDQGKNFSASATDQRDEGFVRTFDDPAVPDAAGGDGTDIGAFEAQAELLDTTPPIITCPDSIVANATSPTGAVVSFPAPEASDNCSLASVTCTPPSGSTFAIGTTAVTCRAVDGSANTNTCTFSVRVKGAAEQINDLIALVQGLNLKSATANSLIVKLQAAASALSKGNIKGACGNLKDFISLVNAQKDKKQLTAAQADLLICEATRIRSVLDC
jgi:hypothetical protein